MKNGVIYTAPAYWDFQWHMPLIQSFIYGDNFPPQNESFSGLPQTYHFFYDLLTAIYSTWGVPLVFAVNFISIAALFFLFLAIIGFAEEIFRSYIIGAIAVLFTMTTSSLHFVYYFNNFSHLNIPKTISSLLFNTDHPYMNAFVPGHNFGYNGNMFNMFYFLAERHLVMAMLFLVIAMWFIYQRKHFTNSHMFLLGAGMGLYFLWQISITITVMCSLVFLFIFDNYRKKTLYMLAGLLIVFSIHVIYFKIVQQSVWFLPDIGNYPRLNFNFPTMDDVYPFTPLHAVGYYFFAYGLKIVLLFLGIFYLWKKNKKILYLLLSVIVPSFILVNAVQLIPQSIYDNHKWLRPINIFIDLVAGYALFNYCKHKNRIIIGIVLFISVTLSGLVELPPYFNTKPIDYFVDTRTPLVSDIRYNTPAKSVFIAQDSREIQYAGRIQFLGNHTGGDIKVDSQRRMDIINQINMATTLQEFCKTTKTYSIDFIESGTDNLPKIYYILPLTGYSFKSINSKKENVTIIDINKICMRV